MSNQYERSAIAESDKGMSTLVADHAAGQQDSLPAEMSPLQLLYSVVEHNVANPDKRIKLSPEQGKEIMRDFVDFVAGSSDTPTNEDGQPKTFNEMDDNELLKCLSDYLGSGVANTSINGAGIELAQDLLAEMYMSEEELAELTNPKTPNARELKEKKLLEKMRDAAEEEAAQLKETRDKWDKDTHDYGGEQLTGAEIMERINWFSKKENQDKVRKELIKNGKSEKEADEIIAKMKERDELMKRERDGDKAKPPLTAADKDRLATLNKDVGVKLGGATVAEVSKQDKGVDVAADSPKNMSAEENKDETIRMRQSMAAKKNEASVPVPAKEQDEQLSSSAKAYEYFSSARPMGKDFKAVSEASNSQENDLELTKPKAQVAYVPKLQADAALM